jgi:uncharacterized protein YxeA
MNKKIIVIITAFCIITLWLYISEATKETSPNIVIVEDEVNQTDTFTEKNNVPVSVLPNITSNKIPEQTKPTELELVLQENIEKETPFLKFDEMYYELERNEEGELQYRSVDLHTFSEEAYELNLRFFYDDLAALNSNDATNKDLGHYSPDNEQHVRDTIANSISNESTTSTDMVVCRELKCMAIVTLDPNDKISIVELGKNLQKMPVKDRKDCQYNQIPTQTQNLLISITCNPNSPE